MGNINTTEASINERITLAIDTSDKVEAKKFIKMAQDVGIKSVKCGLELSSALGWQVCSELVADENMDWIADAKLADIPNTTAKTVKNFRTLDHPPIGITIHTTSGIESMKVAQAEANSIMMLGVTALSSIDEPEIKKIYRTSTIHKVIELAHNAVDAGLNGIVCSPNEIIYLKKYPRTSNLFSMVPGIRLEGAKVQDQALVGSPGEAIRNGADLLVIGREVTQMENPTKAFEEIIEEIKSSFHE